MRPSPRSQAQAAVQAACRNSSRSALRSLPGCARVASAAPIFAGSTRSAATARSQGQIRHGPSQKDTQGDEYPLDSAIHDPGAGLLTTRRLARPGGNGGRTGRQTAADRREPPHHWAARRCPSCPRRPRYFAAAAMRVDEWARLTIAIAQVVLDVRAIDQARPVSTPAQALLLGKSRRSASTGARSRRSPAR